MGAYKKLNKQDAYITTYVAHKQWSIPLAQYPTYEIYTALADESYKSSLAQLYYPSKSLGNIVSHSFDYYPQTTLYNSESRNLTGDALVVSIPRALYGTSIKPGVTLGFYGAINSQFVNRNILDDLEGNLYISGSSPRLYVGDIIYTHGIAVITKGDYVYGSISSVAFKSSQPIYTHNYHCKIRESEFNYTYNPSAVSSSLETVYNNLGYAEGYYEYNYSTGDYDSFTPTVSNVSDGVIKSNLRVSGFQPYITTVGLYNDASELIAVGKMSQPVPKPANTEMTIVVKIDI